MEMELFVDGINVLWWCCCAVSEQAITALQFSHIFVRIKQFKMECYIHSHKVNCQCPLN